MSTSGTNFSSLPPAFDASPSRRAETLLTLTWRNKIQAGIRPAAKTLTESQKEHSDDREPVIVSAAERERSMPNTVTSVSRRASGRRTLWVSPEIDAADRRLAEARERVDRLSASIAEDMRLGSAKPEARELLAAYQQALREMVVDRDAVLAELRKTSPSDTEKRAGTDRDATPESSTAERAQAGNHGRQGNVTLPALRPRPH